jgi:hypothetical protein
LEQLFNKVGHYRSPAESCHGQARKRFLGFHRSIFVVVFLKADVIQPSAVGLVPLDGFSDAFLK